MQDQPSKGEEPAPPIVNEIEALARRLRAAGPLEPGTRENVARLLGDLARALDQPELAPHSEDLAHGTVQLVRAVQDQHPPGRVEAARERLEGAVARAETAAPMATEIVLRLIDVLGGLGI